MKIKCIHIRNFRTIETLDIELPWPFTAICGANDAGKTNIIRAIRALLRDDQPYFAGDDDEVSVKDDFPKWLESPPEERQIVIELTLEVHRKHDSGLYQFLKRQLELGEQPETLQLQVTAKYFSERTPPRIEVRSGDSCFEGVQAQEVFRKLSTSKCILFHNSPQSALTRLRHREGFGLLREFAGEVRAELDEISASLEKKLQKIAKRQQTEMERLLGRLENKYRVRLSVSAFDLGWLPFNLTLGDSKHTVPLDNWGSGTQNRTLILHALFRAKQIAEADEAADQITPIIVVEEPESFLHPSAQAEFGRVLQDLAEEFGVQVIVTTHSPYLLSIARPESNVLLERKMYYSQVRETQRRNSTSDDWMAAFADVLGVSSEEIRPWRALFGSGSQKILLVEGDTDRQYLEMLRDPAHGEDGMRLDGEIVSYDGTGALQNTSLLRFVKSRYKKVFILYDLDCEGEIEKSLRKLDLCKGQDYYPVGLELPAKRSIEGLLPNEVVDKVHAANGELVRMLTSNRPDERTEAKRLLKSAYLAEFKANARPGLDFYREFYKLAKVINAAFGD